MPNNCFKNQKILKNDAKLNKQNWEIEKENNPIALITQNIAFKSALKSYQFYKLINKYLKNNNLQIIENIFFSLTNLIK